MARLCPQSPCGQVLAGQAPLLPRMTGLCFRKGASTWDPGAGPKPPQA